MIEYPFLKEQPSFRQVVDTFKGYHHNLRIGANEFYEMENMTSEDYPVLSVRGKRSRVGQLRNSGYCTGAIYVAGKGVFMTCNEQNDQDDPTPEHGSLYLMQSDGEIKEISHSLLPGRKSLAFMGKRLIIAPDMVGVNIESMTAAKLEYVHNITGGMLYFQMCRLDGSLFTPMVRSAAAPASPGDGDYWLDQSVYPYVLKQYSASQGMWTVVSSTYVKIWGQPLYGHRFYEGDGITISGLGMENGVVHSAAAASLNGSHLIAAVDEDSITLSGMIDYSTASSFDDSGRGAQFAKLVPELDLIVESGNRLWGCSNERNELYACKLGDPKNWNCFQGLSTDSWVASIGTPGEFTGAVVQNGYPIFYKEDCKHKIWPSSTGAHQVAATPCNGVEQGSCNSLAVLGGTVFYKSPFGICADDGGGPVEIGHGLGSAQYHNACGAVHDHKYYICLRDSQEKSHLFVYDIARKLWHREDGTYTDCLAAGGGGIFLASGGELWDLTGATGTPEGPVPWMVQTGDLGLEIPEQKYISRLTLRVYLEPGATLELYAQYDREPVWVKLGQVYGTSLRSFSLPVRPRRCDQLRLKLQGSGMCKIYSITKTIEKGSEQ